MLPREEDKIFFRPQEKDGKFFRQRRKAECYSFFRRRHVILYKLLYRELLLSSLLGFRFMKCFGFAVLFWLLASGTAGAETPSLSSVNKIAPHRAIYAMALGKVKNGSPIQGATGTMLFEWADACEGWAIQQQMKLHFIYAEADEAEISSSVVTWESKDGKSYRFNVRRLTDGQEDESFKGLAKADEKGGQAVYAVPKDRKETALPVDTLFPSAHTKLIIEKALAGEKLFTRPVFDGSDEEGLAYVSAFVGSKIERPRETEMNPELRKLPLLNQAAWPVRLAFYKPEDQTGQPDYEMDLTLQANGVARSMSIDYGDFTVSGLLVSVEAIPPEVSCSESR